jgi:NitT/TauT family transport system permease protein
VVLIIWALASKAFNTPVLPDPFMAISEFFKVLDKLYIHMLYSFFRIFCAVLLSMLLAVPLGLVIGRYRLLDFLFAPLIYMLYPVPKIALLPIVMLLLGLGDISKVVMILIILFFQIIVTCRDEVTKIQKESYYFMQSIGASEFQIFHHLIIPYCMPAIFTSVRLSLGTSIAVLFFSENYGTRWGMGYFITDSWARVDYPEMFAGIIGLSIMGVLLFVAVDLIEKRISRWKQ